MGPSPARHETHSDLEARVCEAMRAQNVGHEHRSLRFRVQLASGETVQYRPDIVARRGAILFLVEPLADTIPQERVELLSRFLNQHSPEIVLIVLASKENLGRLPVESYDEVYDAADLAAAVRRIRRQDPGGLIRPFPKPRSGAGL